MPPFCVGGNCITTHSVVGAHLIFTSPPEGVARYCFHPVCLCVCVSVCPANILVFYFSAIRKDIDLKCIQDTYRSKVKVTGTVSCYLKVQSYHKN